MYNKQKTLSVIINRTMKVSIELVKAFTKDKTLGNPAGVVHDASQMSDGQMLKVAKILGFSESAFIQRSDKADFKVRFFAVKEEVDFCGHATVATFHSLVEQGVIKLDDKEVVEVTQETKAGIFPVACYKDGKIMMTQSDPTYGEIIKDRELIASLLGLKADDLGNLPLQVVATTFPNLTIPVKSLSVLRKIKPDFNNIAEYTKQKNTNAFYVFTDDTTGQTGDFAARFFNPLLGINEDPATGVAAGSLGCYADKYIFKGNKKQIVIIQGFDMGKPSTIYVDIADKVQVGGYAVSFGQRELDI